VDYKGPREKTICEMQQDYTAATGGVERARNDMARLIEGAVHYSATGHYLTTPESRVARTIDTTHANTGVTIGGTYCKLLSVFGVKEAQAAEPTAAPQLSGSRARRTRERELVEKQRAAQDSARQLPNPASPIQGPTFVPPSAGYAPANGDATLGAIGSLRDRIAETERTRNMFGVEIHKKFSLAVACIVFILIGAPVALRFPRGGVGLVISVSLSVFALYYVGLIAGQSLAENGTLSPFWSMWLANIVFTLVGLVLLARMGKESGSSRGGDMREMIDLLRAWFAGWLRRLGLKADRRRRIS
jgi:lipopolysaccharide export system permease protein